VLIGGSRPESTGRYLGSKKKRGQKEREDIIEDILKNLGKEKGEMQSLQLQKIIGWRLVLLQKQYSKTVTISP